MTEKEITAFVDKYTLHCFDGLIEVELNDGTRHRAVWITVLPGLDKSVDGKFQGVNDEWSVFYLFDEKKYEVWHPSEIKNLKCLQQNYLSRHV